MVIVLRVVAVVDAISYSKRERERERERATAGAKKKRKKEAPIPSAWFKYWKQERSATLKPTPTCSARRRGVVALWNNFAIELVVPIVAKSFRKTLLYAPDLLLTLALLEPHSRWRTKCKRRWKR